jgi:CheY-like chemotaxis protein
MHSHFRDMGCLPDFKRFVLYENLRITGQMNMNQTETVRRSLQVLHLEDDLTDAELIRAELEENHIPCTVTLIASAHEFAITLRERPIDLILSDSSVPGFDTLSALKTTREHHGDVPFVFISDNSSPKIRAEAFRLGASDFISKRELSKLPRLITALVFGKNTMPTASPLPEIGIPVIVQCQEYRCLGFLGADGKWRDFCSSVELPPVFSWLEV